MNDLKILAIKTTWSYLVLNAEEAGALFYQNLFSLDPSLRLLFKRDIDAQAGKLTDMLTYIIAKLQYMDEVEPVVEALALRHVRYGTQPEHYQTVGRALLLTLERLLDKHWDDQAREAWVELYDRVAQTMIKAASGPVATP